MPSLHIKLLYAILVVGASIGLTFLSAYGCHIAIDHIQEWWGFVFGGWSLALGMAALIGGALSLIKIYE